MVVSRQRIELTDTMPAIVAKMSEGNPGACDVVCRMLKEGASIDPDDAFEGLGAVFGLDTSGIYRQRIWMLYKDVCKQSLANTIGVLRSVQLGLVPERVLHHAIDNRGDGLDVEATIALVKKRLPNFGRAAVATE